LLRALKRLRRLTGRSVILGREGMSNPPTSHAPPLNRGHVDAGHDPRGAPTCDPPQHAAETTIHVVDSPVAVLPSQTPPPPLKPPNIIDEITSSLPPGIELHRAYRFQPPSLKRDKLELAVLKVHTPEHLEAKLADWRRSIEEEFPEFTVLVRRVQVDQNLQSNLRNRFRSSPLLTDVALPELDTMLNLLCGCPPAPRAKPRPTRPKRVNLRHKHMVAIDSCGTVDREDLVFGEVLSDGLLQLSVAFVDVTDYVSLGGDVDRYALRVGSPVWGRSRVISPLGPSLRCGPGSFKEGEARAAWVIESVISPTESRPLLSSTLKRAWVVNHANLDPAAPVEASPLTPLGRNLAALAEITHILENKRFSSRTPIRIDGEGLLSRVVAQCMIRAKHFLGQYADTVAKIPAIFRIHQFPSEETIMDYINKLHEIGIPASLTDFGPEFFSGGILRALEEKSHPSARILSNSLLDAFMLRSQYSTRNVGHYGLGLDAYLEIKPRDATGLANQLQLDAYCSGKELLDDAEMSRRADTLNQKRWDRDIRQYKIRFLEDLTDHLSHVGNVFLGTIKNKSNRYLYCEVQGFYKWGVLKEPIKEHLLEGDLVPLRLEGFDIEQMRYVFSLFRA
jgi:hypothetical protein